MGVLNYFEISWKKDDGLDVVVKFMLKNKKELWVCPQNANWSELKDAYNYVKKQHEEGKLFTEEELNEYVPKINEKKSFWNRVYDKL